jgi:hypothetical protein
MKPPVAPHLLPCYNPVEKEEPMQTIKTALFETLVESAVADDTGGYLFTLDGKTYRIADTLEISRIAQEHGYIIIY